MKTFSDLNSFLEWINTLGKYIAFNNYLYAQGYTVAMMFTQPYTWAIGQWNAMNGGSSSQTNQAIVPGDTGYTPRYSLGNWLAGYVGGVIKKFKIISIDSTYYTLQGEDYSTTNKNIRELDVDSNWYLTTAPITPGPDGPGPDGPGPDGGSGASMAVLVGIGLLACAAKPIKRKKRGNHG